MEKTSAKDILTLDKKTPAKSLEPTVTTAFLAAMFVILPLCAGRSYYSIRYIKGDVFWCLTAAYIACMIILFAIRLVKGKIEDEEFELSDVLFPLFAIVYIVATLISGYGKAGFLAKDNREQGILTFLLYGAAFFFVRRYGKESKVLRQSAIFAMAAVCIFGILNQFHIDPLRFIINIKQKYWARFTSTIGNIDFYGAYCVLLFPICYYHLLNVTEKREVTVYAVVSTIALLGTVAARTEGALLGLMVAVAIMPLMCRGEALRRYGLSLSAMLLILGIYRFAVAQFGGYKLSSLLNTLLSPIPYGVMMATALALAIFLHKANDNGIERFIRLYKVLFFTAIICLFIAFIIANLFFAESLPQKLAKYLVITPEWGTDRGRIWARAMDMLKSFKPMQWIIGDGSGCVARWDMNNRIFDDALLDSVHNEYLQYLLTSGIAGLALYVVFIVDSIARGIKNSTAGTKAVACGCIAYACHSAISFAQNFTTPLFFLLLFILPNNKCEEENVISKGKKRISFAIVFVSIAVLLAISWWCTNMTNG